MLIEAIKKAVEEADYPRARMLLGQLRDASPSDPAGAKAALERAIRTIRIQRAHDAARLVQLTRTSAYKGRGSRAVSTWTLDG